ncbi:MAG TPA: hypothetical protein VGI43_20115 [Mucilaginibacter sp.]|jgi:hypothetical protein
MTIAGIFSRETTIYVSTSSKLNAQQTESVSNELLHLMGCPNCDPGFSFEFIDADDLIQANAFVDKELKVSVGN